MPQMSILVFSMQIMPQGALSSNEFPMFHSFIVYTPLCLFSKDNANHLFINVTLQEASSHCHHCPTPPPDPTRSHPVPKAGSFPDLLFCQCR